MPDTASSLIISWPRPSLPLSPLFRSGCTGRGLDTRLGLLLVALTEFIWGVGCRKIDCYPRPPAAKFSPRPKLPPGQPFSQLHPNNCDQKPAGIWGVIAFFSSVVIQLPPYRRSVPAPSQTVAGGAINPHGKQSREKKKEQGVHSTNHISRFMISSRGGQSGAA